METIADETTAKKYRTPRVHQRDNVIRCATVLLLVSTIRALHIASLRLLSADHPARVVGESAALAMRDLHNDLPWRGYVPRHPICLHDAAWLGVLLLSVVLVLDLFGLGIDKAVVGHNIPLL